MSISHGSSPSPDRNKEKKRTPPLCPFFQNGTEAPLLIKDIPGFGLRASHRFFEIFRAVGIQDIAAKMPRARNPMNSVKACVEALTSQKDPEELAIGRGKKFVDVRKVYYGGNVF